MLQNILLTCWRALKSYKFGNLTTYIMTQCAKIIVGFMANVGNVFYPTFTNVFFYFVQVFTFFNVFFIFIATFITSMTWTSTLRDWLQVRWTSLTSTRWNPSSGWSTGTAGTPTGSVMAARCAASVCTESATRRGWRGGVNSSLTSSTWPTVTWRWTVWNRGTGSGQRHAGQLMTSSLRSTDNCLQSSMHARMDWCREFKAVFKGGGLTGSTPPPKKKC